MVAGDTCFVREGTVRETVIHTKSGTKAKPICFLTWRGCSMVFLANPLSFHPSWSPLAEHVRLQNN